MYSTTSAEKKIAAYRINRLTIERLRAKAKMENTSVNALVDCCALTGDKESETFFAVIWD